MFDQNDREREARRIVRKSERAGWIKVAQSHCCREVHLRLWNVMFGKVTVGGEPRKATLHEKVVNLGSAAVPTVDHG